MPFSFSYREAQINFKEILMKWLKRNLGNVKLWTH